VDDIGAGERAAIERIRALLPAPPPHETWIGDDAAVVEPPGRPLLLAADLVVEGVHADLSLVGLDDVGWKALAVNVSDIAAMGGRPLHALVSVAGPSDTDLDLLYAGIAEAAREYRCAVVGGDLSNAPSLTVAVAVTGECPAGRPVLRSGARPGDALLVTGPLGRSAAGLAVLRRRARTDAEAEYAEAHRRPRARVAEGMVAAATGATAMIDVSDGLAADVRNLASASGVGFDLYTVPADAGWLGSEEDALFGGEDYELLFATPDVDGTTDAFLTEGLRPPIVVGHCTADPAERSLNGRPLPQGGWEHRFGHEANGPG
jgi:thiamine-monophosphate kinase